MTATLPAPRISDPGSVPALRWGVIGAGGIARSFIRALHGRTPQRVVLIAARDADRTARTAADLGVPAATASVDTLLGSSEVDAVYVATPHVHHASYALRAIAAGKPVLVEKPIAMSAAETSAIRAAAQNAGVLVMEAMWTRYLPQADVIRQLLARGDIGRVTHVEAAFGFQVPYDAQHRLWAPELGGGALLDMGVYPISFASSVLGAPEVVSASGMLAPTAVDARAAVQLGTASGATAHLLASLVEHPDCRAVILGTLGRIEVHPYFHAPSGVDLVLGQTETQDRVSWRDTALEDPVDGLAYQATAFADYLGQGLTESPLHPLAELVEIMTTIDTARRQVATASQHRTEE